MKLPETKKSTLVTVLTVGILGLVSGVLLISLNADFLLRIIFIVMGIVTILSAIPGLVAGGQGDRVSLVVSLISLVIGILMIFWHSTVLKIVIGIYLLLLPAVEVLLSRDKLAALRHDLPQMIVGLVLLLVTPSKAVGVLLDVAGCVVILLSALYVVVSLVADIRRQTKREASTGNRIFVDHTGDGVVDVVYVDTTGDGKPDTAKRYRKKK